MKHYEKLQRAKEYLGSRHSTARNSTFKPHQTPVLTQHLTHQRNTGGNEDYAVNSETRHYTTD